MECRVCATARAVAGHSRRVGFVLQQEQQQHKTRAVAAYRRRVGFVLGDEADEAAAPETSDDAEVAHLFTTDALSAAHREGIAEA